MRSTLKLIGAILMMGLFLIRPATMPVKAQSVPFWLIVSPTYDDNKITYKIEFYNEVDWALEDVVIKFRLPEGTHYLEGGGQASLNVDYDGSYVAFSTEVVEGYDSISVAGFVLEVTDPSEKVFVTQAEVSWAGAYPGSYVTEDIDIDITREPLNWRPPALPHLQLEAQATVEQGVVTFKFFPQNVGWRRMWDVDVNVPIPEGTKFLSAEAPEGFSMTQDGREVFFSIIEMPRNRQYEPLLVKVVPEDDTVGVIKTYAWAKWKNVGWGVGRRDAAEEQFRTGDIIVDPQHSKWVYADRIGDVPFYDYDVTSLDLQSEKDNLKIIFYTAEDVGAAGKPLEFALYIDSDCQENTGQRRRAQGFDYRVRYDLSQGQASVLTWNSENRRWDWPNSININGLVDKNSVTMWLPYDLIGADVKQFCWFGEMVNTSEQYHPEPPAEQVPDRKAPELTTYKIVPSNISTEVQTYTQPAPAAVSTKPITGNFINVGDEWNFLPGWSEPPRNWRSLNFDDGEWYSGPTSIGYGPGKYATDLSRIIELQDEDQPALVEHTDPDARMVFAALPSGTDNDSVFLRHIFTVTDLEPTAIDQLDLTIQYKGGFVAYLNGVEVARRGLGTAGSAVPFDTLATVDSPDQAQTISLNESRSLLTSGPNVLAIQVHRTADDAELLVKPSLSWRVDPAQLNVSTSSPSLAEPVLTPATPAPPSITEITGKIAVPLDNGQGYYDVHVFSIPDGELLTTVPNARQPNLRYDGQRMLVNREGGGIENVFEINLVDGTSKQVSDAPEDWHPFYDPWGNRVVYGNTDTALSGIPVPAIEDGELRRHSKTGEIIYTGIRRPFLFVQCGLLPPHLETDPLCRDIAVFDILVPAGQMGDLQGSHPVWTSNDMIVYKGCNTWAGSSLCGIFIVSSASTKRLSDGFIPVQLTTDTSDTPTDTKGNRIAFMSQEDGDWEAYTMDFNGRNIKNVSDSPGSNDGLPTISPDGNWVAFVSDRDGTWGVWVAPIVGGTAEKVLDLPAVPWGSGSTTYWTNERISWSP
ncbi:MAG: PD40 domain-containing protein [Anaerolineae bacterium]|nr:PD40 domain-containing protein [Anaerolineae bacterium]